MNKNAMKILGKQLQTALRNGDIRMHTVAQNFGVPPSFVSSVISGDFDPQDERVSQLADTFGIRPELVDACRRDPPKPVIPADAQKPKKPQQNNVINLASYKRKCRPTTSSPTD